MLKPLTRCWIWLLCLALTSFLGGQSRRAVADEPDRALKQAAKRRTAKPTKKRSK